jgi:hypothetical protein
MPPCEAVLGGISGAADRSLAIRARATPGRGITLWGFPGAVACRTLSVPRLPISVKVGCDVHPERSH